VRKALPRQMTPTPPGSPPGAANGRRTMTVDSSKLVFKASGGFGIRASSVRLYLDARQHGEKYGVRLLLGDWQEYVITDPAEQNAALSYCAESGTPVHLDPDPRYPHAGRSLEWMQSVMPRAK
jgi:hypothetical protein